MVVSRTVSWVDSTGVAHPLRMEPGAVGLDMVPVSVITAPAVGGAGSVVQNVRHPERPLLVPIWFEGSTEESTRLASRAWARQLDPKRGAGVLKVEHITGEVRLLTAYYTGGAEGDEALERQGRTYVRWVLSFLAPDPYWYGEDASSQVWTTDPGLPFFPILPLTLSPSNVLGDQVVQNPGDVEAWPVWTLRGPFEGVTMTNDRVRRSLSFGALGAGEVVVIDTRPQTKTVRDGAGANRFADFAGTLWQFAPDRNDISIDATGSTADTSIAMWYQPRYLTA